MSTCGKVTSISKIIDVFKDLTLKKKKGQGIVIFLSWSHISEVTFL